MKVIGLIVEYNPFHNGHLYQIKKIKELYPDSIIILILNGYFLERGIVSIESKEEKTRLALKYGIDIVIELPFVFGSNSGDIFASSSLELLNELGVEILVFGSESNDVDNLIKVAKYQQTEEFKDKIRTYLDEGYNYPTALNKAGLISISEPNDLLGISYIKAILENNYNIKPITIKRTNSYLDTTSNDIIISSTNIREKIKNNITINEYIPEGNILSINNKLLFNLIKYKIITDDDLSKYLTVDEGIEYRLKKVINEVNNIDELVKSIKTKRYTYNRIMRMLIHILIGLTKEDKLELTHNEYIRLLGFNKLGAKYLNSIKKKTNIPIITKFTSVDSKIKDYELVAANIYQMITNENVLEFEYSNKPIKLD
jgi:predicted nucleotidyltransferase